MNLLTEAVESITLPCSLALLVPGVIVTLLAQRRAPVAAAAFLVSAGVVAWVRFAGWVDATPDGAGRFIAAGLVVGGALAVHRGRRVGTAVGAVGVAVAAAWTWKPCVGLALAEVVNRVDSDPLSTLGPMVAFVVVLGIPLIALAAAPVAVPSLRVLFVSTPVVAIAAGASAAIGAALVAGRYDDLLGELLARSAY